MSAADRQSLMIQPISSSQTCLVQLMSAVTKGMDSAAGAGCFTSVFHPEHNGEAARTSTQRVPLRERVISTHLLRMRSESCPSLADLGMHACNVECSVPGV
jgi:hypothetical protein